MLTLTGHTRAVTALAFGPGGTVASAGRDGTVRLWDAAGERAVLDAGDAVMCLAFTSDGRRLAAGGADKRVRVWDAATGKAFGPFGPTQPAAVTGLAFLPDRRTLAVASGDRGRPEQPGGLHLLDLQTAGVRARLFEAGGVWTMTGVPGRRAVAWSTGDRRLVSWEVTSPQPRPLPSLKKPASALAASPDGRSLAVASDWAVTVYGVDTGTVELTGPCHKGLVTAVAFAPDGRALATAGRDEAVRFWDPADGRELAAYHWPVGRVTALAFSPDGATVAAAGEGGDVVVWDV